MVCFSEKGQEREERKEGSGGKERVGAGPEVPRGAREKWGPAPILGLKVKR